MRGKQGIIFLVAAVLVAVGPNSLHAERTEGMQSTADTKEEHFGIAMVNSRLNIRQKPGTDSLIIGKIPADGVCHLEELDGGSGWRRIRYGEIEGYVSEEYLLTGEAADRIAGEQGEENTKEVSVGDAGNIREELISFASQFIGNPYVWGGTSLTRGADCSGFVQSVYRHFGIELPRVSVEQSEYGEKIAVSEARPGDLIFYAKNGRVYHVVIFLGEGQVLHASSERVGITVSALNEKRAVWAVDVLES